VVRRYWVARSHCVCLEGRSLSEPDFAHGRAELTTCIFS
jgi:hypothetical protein